MGVFGVRPRFTGLRGVSQSRGTLAILESLSSIL